MKCTGKNLTGLLLAVCVLSFPGCGKEAPRAVYADAYDIYDTSKKYHLIDEDDSSCKARRLILQRITVSLTEKILERKKRHPT